MIFFRFCQNQQLSANCWLDCWEAIKCTVPDFKIFLPVLNSNFRIIWQKFFLYLHYILWFKSKKFVNKKLRYSKKKINKNRTQIKITDSVGWLISLLSSALCQLFAVSCKYFLFWSAFEKNRFKNKSNLIKIEL